MNGITTVKKSVKNDDSGGSSTDNEIGVDNYKKTPKTIMNLDKFVNAVNKKIELYSDRDVITTYLKSQSNIVCREIGDRNGVELHVEKRRFDIKSIQDIMGKHSNTFVDVPDSTYDSDASESESDDSPKSNKHKKVIPIVGSFNKFVVAHNERDKYNLVKKDEDTIKNFNPANDLYNKDTQQTVVIGSVVIEKKKPKHK